MSEAALKSVEEFIMYKTTSSLIISSILNDAELNVEELKERVQKLKQNFVLVSETKRKFFIIKTEEVTQAKKKDQSATSKIVIHVR